MRHRPVRIAAQLTALLLAFAPACRSHAPGPSAAAADSAAFAALQDRGKEVMGVDQYASMHIFEDRPDGGLIVLERADSADTADIASIRRHMRTIAAAFARGDFALPGQVHAQAVPGTDIMTTRASLIRYQPVDLPLGGSVIVMSTDSASVAAIHTFLAFQRREHHAAGHDHTM